jgi:hypothetical protein
MMASKPKNKLLPAKGMIACGMPVPMPVRDTNPITIPTQAAATMRGSATLGSRAKTVAQVFLARPVTTSPTSISPAIDQISASAQVPTAGATHHASTVNRAHVTHAMHSVAKTNGRGRIHQHDRQHDRQGIGHGSKRGETLRAEIP